jgi:hypothetical protein
MKSSVVVLLATAALAFATPAAAFNYNTYYLVTFTAPGGAFQHCIQLTQTQQYLSEGYPHSGTWVDTDFPDTTGTWLVYNTGTVLDFHLAGSVDGSGILTIDGKEAAGDILKEATFDYFDSSGTYFSAGSVTIEESDSSCTSSTAKSEFLPSGINRLPVH